MTPLTAGAGFAPLNIPDWPQTGDGTPLAARCLVLDDGHVRLALLSLTVIALARREADAIREAAARAAGVPTSHLMLACTHVHTGPPTHASDQATRTRMADFLALAAVEAARQAATTQPARVGVATDHLPGISRVRRILRRDGSVITLRRAWPQYWGWATDPETVGAEEPLDDLLTVLRLEDDAGRPFGALFHFTCHPIPDYFGWAARLVEQTLPGVVCLVLNGCQGSVDAPFEIPLRGRTQAEQLPILGDILGYRTLELLARAETMDAHVLGAALRPLWLPLDRRFLAAPGEKATLWPEAIREGGFSTITQCLRVGDLALAGIPGEAHVGFGGEVQRVSPFGLTRSVGLANDECCYLFPEEARVRGGYEADPCFWGVVTGEGVTNLLTAITDCFTELSAAG